MIFKWTKNKNEINKIGILYICTGRYSFFWESFYRSAQKYFCRKSELHYFVFTDQVINFFDNSKIKHINQPLLGWPYDTLKRFHFFLERKADLEKMDFLFFFNANMIFNKTISESNILPKINDSGLVSVLHSSFYKHDTNPIFEDNKLSTAYVNANKEFNYFQGCLIGGKTKEYLIMAEEIKKSIDIDLKNSIIAKWHDESHMNKYLIKHNPIALHPGFAYPQNAKLPFKKMIVQLDKALFGGHNYLRNVID